ncbi:MAG: CZB domain-containing protein [Sideroxydans sp.]|nr:CZB domain-containing protein [Sideroxydans sp.]
MSWWKSIFGGEDVKEAAGAKADAAEEVGGLNFKTALEAHIKWKVRLMGAIDGTGTETLDPRIVSVDNQCALGKWIYGQGGNDYGNNPEFKQLVAAHTNFHKCAGHVLDLHLDGKDDVAKQEIEGGAFAKASHETSRHLMRLWRALGI